MILALFPPRIRKEVRTLAPAWLACALFAVATGGVSVVGPLPWVAYLVVAIALGSMSLGQEYSHRTLSMLLAQPVGRRRLFVEKAVVLVSLQLALGLLASFALVSGSRFITRGPADWTLAVSIGPLLCGLFIAPWLTLVCRGVLAGTVFTVAVPVLLWFGSQMAATFIYGDELSTIPAAGELAFDIFRRAFAVICLLGAVSSWRMFSQLEALDTRAFDLHVPVPGRRRDLAAPATVNAPFWPLLKKEVRLQQLTLAVSALYIVGWFAILLTRQWTPTFQALALNVLTTFHSVVVPMVAGSVASAEERQLGTLPWQTLLPLAGWKQWLLKTVVAGTLAFVLTMALPALLLLAAPAEAHTAFGPITSPAHHFLALGVFLVSLYISSLCPTPLRALLCALVPSSLILAFTARWIVDGFALGTDVLRSVLQYGPTRLSSFLTGDLARWWGSLLAIEVVMVVGMASLLMRFALINHRAADNSAIRVGRQLLTAAAFLAVTTGLFHLESESLRSHLRQLARDSRRNAPVRRVEPPVQPPALPSTPNR